MKSRIQLLQAHTHAGTDCQAGDLIEIDDDQADWLIRIGVARSIPADPDRTIDFPSEPVAETGSSIPTREKRR